MTSLWGDNFTFEPRSDPLWSLAQ
ncbi:MAG: hypothetical protein RIR73_2719, partial [Chloroflexota bacterium]